MKLNYVPTNTMSGNAYQELADRTAPKSYNCFRTTIDNTEDKSIELIHAQFGICSESGELADALKKWLIYGQQLDKQNIREECGDLMWYIALALKSVDMEMSETMLQNIEKLQKRYPEKFTEQAALARADKD